MPKAKGNPTCELKGLGGFAFCLVPLALCLTLAEPAMAQERDPFEKGAVGIEFGAAPLVEIWNLNGHREPMLEGIAAFWGAIRDGLAIGIEFQHGYVFQHTPGALVQGISPLVRWKIADRQAWDWFLQAGPGVSWSDLPAPPRGTRFNYLFQAGAGVLKRTGSSQHVLLAYRFLHLSNNHREGRAHNPDLEMMGIYAGWSFSF
jgi:hypothetical protein